MPEYINPFVAEAEQRLDSANFNQLSLAELNLQPISAVNTLDGKPVFYQVHGDLGAKSVVVEPLAYSVRIKDLQPQVGLAAKEAALGDDYCVVGVEAHDPKLSRYSKEQSKKIRRGNYQPLADRVLTVIEDLDLKDDQELILQGYSMAADIAVETNYNMLTDENRGIRRVDKLGAVEYARGHRHGLFGGLAVILAFSRSGGNLYKNIVASNSKAMFEATGIDPSNLAGEKEYLARVNKYVTSYVLADIRGNIDGFLGAATDGTLQHINDIGKDEAQRPRMKVGRMDKSPICLPEFLDNLTPHQDLTTFVEPGDHATGDEIRRDVAFVLRTALS